MKHTRFFAIHLSLPVLQASANLTEQRCYHAPGQLADPEIIPCIQGSDDAPAVLHCCKRGSHCLEEASCWDPGTGVTYQYGCTDPKYEGDNCPAKCGLDTEKSNWVGMVYCASMGGWICHHPDHCGSEDCSNDRWDPLLDRPAPVLCKELKYDDNVAAAAGSPLQSIMLLPQNENQVNRLISSYDKAYTQSTSPSTYSEDATVTKLQATARTGPHPSRANTDLSNIVTTDSTALPTITNALFPPTNQDSSDQNRTRTLAIGLGAGIPIFLALVGTLIFILIKRRRKSDPFSLDRYLPAPAPTGPTTFAENKISGYAGRGGLDGSARPAELGGAYEGPYGRGELQGDQGARVYEMPSPVPVALPVAQLRGGQGNHHLHPSQIQQIREMHSPEAPRRHEELRRSEELHFREAMDQSRGVPGGVQLPHQTHQPREMHLPGGMHRPGMAADHHRRVVRSPTRSKCSDEYGEHEEDEDDDEDLRDARYIYEMG